MWQRPGLAAMQAAATVDHISTGRVELGIGAGWNEPGYADLVRKRGRPSRHGWSGQI
jgi:alkanesulfonate monooxygenase SsuD/methylene tetrahydromethanopterin reductase-like flavin-dependent oxidoreductase (luciferase family)